MRMAGKDATRIFTSLHPPGTLESDIDAYQMMGLVGLQTVKEVEIPEEKAEGAGKMDKIPLGQIIGLPDFEVSLVGRHHPGGGDVGKQDDDRSDRFIACCRALADSESMVVLLGGTYRLTS